MLKLTAPANSILQATSNQKNRWGEVRGAKYTINSIVGLVR